MKNKIIIADVLYTATDETYYVLNGISKYADQYQAGSLWEAYKLLRADGWTKCGKVHRSGNALVDMFSRGGELTAAWKETDYEEEQASFMEAIANLPIEQKEAVNYQAEPVPKKPPVLQQNKKIYIRSKKTAVNALKRAGYKCEIDGNHSTFHRKSDNIPYMEPHHLVPMEYSDDFNVSLDVEANIVSLCSNCHNHLHYEKGAEVLLKQLYEERRQLLEDAGIHVTLEDLLEMYL